MEYKLDDRLEAPSDNWIFVGTYGHLSAFDVLDEKWTTVWNTNLVGSGYGPVTFHCNKTSVYAGCGSKLFSLATWEGHIQWETPLHGLLGDVDVRIIHDKIICGCNGYVTAVSLLGEKLWDTNLEGTGYGPVTTICVDDTIYAATLGFVFSLSLDGHVLWKFNNPGQGYSGISLSCIDKKQENLLCLGMRGYLRGVKRLSGEQQATASI